MARTRAPKVQKSPVDLASSKPDVVTLKLSVDRETARLLRLEAFGRDCSLGALVTELVRNAPRRFVLTDRSKGSNVPAVSESPEDRSSEGPSRAPGGVGPFGVVSEAS